MSQWYKYPVVSVSATNPSVGPNGSPAPTSSTEVAGINPSGDLQPLQTTADGSLLVSPDPTSTGNVNLTEVGGAAVSLGAKVSASSIPVVLASDETVPISASSLPLPTGAATSALQTSGNSSLASILANQTNGTQETQVTASVLPTGAATSALQTSGNSSLSSILADLTNGTQVTQVSNFPATQPVSGTVTANQGTAGASAWLVNGSGVTQPISAASLPLPTGAATSANQTNGSQVTQVSSLPTPPAAPFSGQKTSTGSAVAIATSQAFVNGVIVQALSTNAASVYVGPSGITTSTGFELQPGQATSMAVNNLNAVFVIASSSGDGVCYIGS
jgi:hypothetical protein